MFFATPLTSGRDLAEARALIESQGLLFEENADELAGLFENDRLVATGARAGYVFKMLAIDPAHQGGETLGALLTELHRLGRAAGHDVFWLFTRPENVASFLPYHFQLLVIGGRAALLELGRGFERWVDEHRPQIRPGRNGACVINGNPFTLGHLHLVEQASRRVDTLYVFIVREDRSVFPYAVRRRLAEQATAHLPNVVVLDTSRYAISAATFPSYFLKKLDQVAIEQMRLDIRLFGQRIAPVFSIRVRFAGTEPTDPATKAYNQVMREVLPECDLEWVELPRTASAGDEPGAVISASRVRAALARGDLETIRDWVPPVTMEYLLSPEGMALRRRIAADTVARGQPPAV